MPITAADIKLMQPERLTDNEDGGGQMTGNPIIDGDINNMFEDISRVNRTYGNTSLRKGFLKVDTPTADLYLDAHTILSAQPADPNVSALLFTTQDFYDERANARQRVESFVVQGPETGLQLRGTQLKGQQTIIVYAPNNGTPAPEGGETYMLQEGETDDTKQFVKILDVTETRENFTYEVSNTIRTFTARQFVLQLSAELKQDYPANDPHPIPRNDSKVYSTQPATSAKYYGTTTLAQAAASGATSVRVADTFAPIIPTASSETPVIDQRPGGFTDVVIPAGAPRTLSVTIAAGTVITLPTAIVPGTLELTVGGTTYHDERETLLNATGQPGIFTEVDIDYAGGTINLINVGSASGSITWTPGAPKTHVPHTGKIEIDETNRNFNYVLSLDPAPSPHTLVVAYQYLGKWYELRDDGAGNLIGEGSGQVDYATGSAVATLTAQPDANSIIFYRWTEISRYDDVTADGYTGTTPVTLTTDDKDLEPGTVTVSWTSGGVAKTATDGTGDGEMAGDATGTVEYSDGRLRLATSDLPDNGTDWSISYDYTPSSVATETHDQVIPDNTNRADVTLSLPGGIAPGSVRFNIIKSVERTVKDWQNNVVDSSDRGQSLSIRDNGNGVLIEGRLAAPVGSINYTTGAATVTGTAILAERDVKKTQQQRPPSNGGFFNYSSLVIKETTTEQIKSQNVQVRYRQPNTPVAGSSTRNPTAYAWRFNLTTNDNVVPGSIILQAGSDIWYDDGNGRLLRNFNTATGTGTPIGTIDYETTLVEIDAYAGRPARVTITPVAILTGEDWGVLFGAYFRTSASPLRPNGFTMRGDDLNGTQYTGQADNEGLITGTGISGEVDLQKGLVQVSFGTKPIEASTVFYNAVSYKNIPLNPAILGLDPVRLPADGKVPILRDADILVLTHTTQATIDTPTADQVVSAGRDRLHDGWIEDDNGTRLDPAQYTLDKEAGTVTLANPFTAQDAEANALVGALHFVHRVDEMALCTEARIDGTLQLAQPLYHDLPANETWVASAVYMGDLRARVKGWASYTTEPAGYDNEGSITTAQYNLVAYPVAIDNRGSVPDRWKLKFTSSTAFELYSENRGLVASGSTAVDFSPINPQTQTPYFTIKSDGWGSGWSVGNTVRFDTDAAAAPFWLIRTVLPGLATVDDDELKIELRGDHN